MQEFTGPSLSNYLLVLGFLIMMLFAFYYLKNKHVISQKLNSKKEDESL